MLRPLATLSVFGPGPRSMAPWMLAPAFRVSAAPVALTARIAVPPPPMMAPLMVMFTAPLFEMA